jgi:hypothetical protein
MGQVQSGAQPFSNYSNFAPILKYKTKTILMCINVQTWHGARVDYSEQLLPFESTSNSEQNSSYKIWNKLHFESFLEFLMGPNLFGKI